MSDAPQNVDPSLTGSPGTVNDENSVSLGELGPVTRKERISSIDVLRGFALLGLISLNMDFPYWNPLFEPGATSLNVAAWTFNELLGGTMHGLFSMLFGAGVVLLTSRAEASGRGAEMGDIYYRRLLWLILFGVLHRYFLWRDILYAYAIIGLFLFPLRRLSPRVLILAGVLVLLLPSIPRTIISHGTRHALMVKATEADALEAAGKKLNAEQKEAQRRWTEKSRAEPPDPEAIQARIDRRRSMGYWSRFRRELSGNVFRHSTAVYTIYIQASGSMMLLGLGLMKLGVFSASRSARFYVVLVAVGYGIGLSLRAYGAYDNLAHNFDWTHRFETGAYLVFNPATWQFSRLLVAVGHVGALMLIYKSGWLSWLMSSLAAVGRMALTSYIMQSIILNLLFHGYALGLYGLLERYQTLYVVITVWILQLVASPIWLKYFRFGPLEWLWRSLTYWKPQPMLIKTAD